MQAQLGGPRIDHGNDQQLRAVGIRAEIDRQGCDALADQRANQGAEHLAARDAVRALEIVNVQHLGGPRPHGGDGTEDEPHHNAGGGVSGDVVRGEESAQGR